MIKLIVTFVLLFFGVVHSHTQKNLQQVNRKIILQTLSFEYLEGCELGIGDCLPVEIIRTNEQDSVVLIFPGGGTQSDVLLISKTDPGIHLQDRKLIHQVKPMLNLTRLKDGEYTASIMSCGLGGACTIILKTRDK